MTLFKLYLTVTLGFVLLKTAGLLVDDSWREDLDGKGERLLFLVLTYVIILLWPVYFAGILLGCMTEGRKRM